MKMRLILAACLSVSAAFAGGIAVKLPSPDGEKTVTLGTNEVTLTRLNWDGLKGGGQYEIQARVENDRVVLIAKTLCANDGIASDRTIKTTILTNKLPQVLTIENTTVTVFRVDQPLPR